MANVVPGVAPSAIDPDATKQRYCIAILALGGQGGGVLADWIAQIGRNNDWYAQATSVPGVAQRTGSTVYYVEFARKVDAAPAVMAQMPTPGDVDVVIASELMEAGRAVLRKFTTVETTTLIGSTHRIYAISEKMTRGDGIGSSERIIEACKANSKKFVGFDMEEAAERAGSIISSIMLGALAGSNALPFARKSFEDAILKTGVAVDANLRGFSEGFRLAQAGDDPVEVQEETKSTRPTTEEGRRLLARMKALPVAAHELAMVGIARLMDYQDSRYADLYLDRLESIVGLDSGDFQTTREAARHLALWMSYEDTIRVADLKIRASRFSRVREEVKASDSQIVQMVEFMHPRFQEVCETLPRGLGKFFLNNRVLSRMFAPIFAKGRHVRTSGLMGFSLLFFLSRMRRFRRLSLRYHEEQERIDGWLTRIRTALREHPELALELVRCQRLIKGYGDTFERGLKEFNGLMARADGAGNCADIAFQIKSTREAMLSETS